MIMRIQRIYDANNRKSKGQIVIILLLFTLVVLTIGLIITQKSVTDLSTSTSSYNSTQAFSAAEAGISDAIAQNKSSGSFALNNLGGANSQAGYNVTVQKDLPQTKGVGVEFPKGTGKELISQFWLANPNDLSAVFPNTTFNVYFGNAGTNPNSSDTPALEVKVLLCAVNGLGNCTNYYLDSYDLDPNNPRSGPTGNGFTPITCTNPSPIQTVLSLNGSQDRKFFCKAPIDLSSSINPNPNSPISKAPIGLRPILVRTRILYSSVPQPVAIIPSSSGDSLPPQVDVYTSTGSSGQSSKTVQAVVAHNVVPSLFDYAMFSIGDIQKTGG